MARRGRRRGERASGTGATRLGADVRHPSLRTRAGTSAGRTLPAPSTAAVMAGANVGLDRSEVLPSDDAQQLSAWAWVGDALGPGAVRIASVHRAVAALRAAGHAGFGRWHPPGAHRRLPRSQRDTQGNGGHTPCKAQHLVRMRESARDCQTAHSRHHRRTPGLSGRRIAIW